MPINANLEPAELLVKERPIEAELQRLAYAIESLDREISDLYKRLGSLLPTSPQATKVQTEVDVKGSSTLYSRLFESVTHLFSLVSSLEDLSHSIEL